MMDRVTTGCAGSRRKEAVLPPNALYVCPAHMIDSVFLVVAMTDSA